MILMLVWQALMRTKYWAYLTLVSFIPIIYIIELIKTYLRITSPIFEVSKLFLKVKMLVRALTRTISVNLFGITGLRLILTVLFMCSTLNFACFYIFLAPIVTKSKISYLYYQYFLSRNGLHNGICCYEFLYFLYV